MESNNETSGLSSYYHYSQPPPPPPQPTVSAPSSASALTTTASATAASPTNGFAIFSQINNNNNNNSSSNNIVQSTGPTQMVYSPAVPSAVATPLESVKRKRGRPRKYGTPEAAAAAKRLAATSPVAPPKKRDQGLTSPGSASAGFLKKSHLSTLGNAGQSFTPHVITVNAGEDVGQKISTFMQQSKREVCIISASGSVSNASLRQPATSGGSITYEGLFDILSLKGSYVRTELGGRAGGMSVCLSSSGGQIVGGGLGGPLIAAGPIQVIVGSFVMDTKKDVAGTMKGDAPVSCMSSPVDGGSVSGMSFRSPVDSSHQNFGGNQFVLQPQGMQIPPSGSMEWRNSSGNGMHQSPENGDYENMPL